MTSVDGHAMARSGRAGPALATAAIGSFVAGTLATAALTFTAPVMAEFALRFGPAESSLTVLAFMAVSCVLSDSLVRGFASLVFGLCLGLVGIDPLTGGARLTFGIPQLLDGIDVVIVTLGLFAVGEVLYAASTRTSERDEIAEIETSIWMSADDWKRSWRPWLRGTAIGFPLGSLPAGGAEIPTLLSYALERRLSKAPEQFGRGAIEGVAGPEAANNASAAGTLVPLLTLGLPTSATAAVMLAAFQHTGCSRGHACLPNRGAWSGR